MRIPVFTLASLMVGWLTISCGGSSSTPDAAPVSYSAPVAINLQAKSSDVVAAAISDEKGIMSEAGNPYGAFITAARQALFGHDPSRIDLVSLSLVLGAQSTGVTKLDDVYTGAVDVLFVMGGSNNSYPVGSAMNPTGTGPVAFTVSFAYANVAPQDVSALLSGNFKVVIRGAPASGFSTKGATADLQVTFAFAAFQ
jgi:hypothetical protein